MPLQNQTCANTQELLGSSVVGANTHTHTHVPTGAQGMCWNDPRKKQKKLIWFLFYRESPNGSFPTPGVGHSQLVPPASRIPACETHQNDDHIFGGRTSRSPDVRRPFLARLVPFGIHSDAIGHAHARLLGGHVGMQAHSCFVFVAYMGFFFDGTLFQ